MPESKTIIKAITSTLKTAGFKKKASNWYLCNEEVIRMINLQKSQYGAQYYINIGIALNSLGTIEHPKENQCHIRFRLTTVAPESLRASIDSALNADDESMPEENRITNISKIITDYALPVLNECSTENDVLKTIKNNKIPNALIRKDVQDLLN